MTSHDVHLRGLRPRPRQSAAPVYPARLGTRTRALAPATDAVLAPACVRRQARAAVGRADFEERRNDMKQYRDSRGWLYQVMPGLEGCAFKGWYLQPGMLSWRCMTQLPWRNTRKEAQADLDTYAAQKGWEAIE